MDPAGKQFGDARLLEAIGQGRSESLQGGIASLMGEMARYKGASRAGKTTCKVNMDSSSSKIDFTTTEGKKEFESEAKMTKGTLTYDCTIQMPKLKSDKGLTDPAKKEWARFMKELEAHENEHVA